MNNLMVDKIRKNRSKKNMISFNDSVLTSAPSLCLRFNFILQDLVIIDLYYLPGPCKMSINSTDAVSILLMVLSSIVFKI